jgi:hypothetical protein
MRARTHVIGLLVVVVMAAQASHAASGSNDAAAAFERLKALVGEWQSVSGSERLSYELVAGGTALLERETGGNRPTMLTVYHRDGDRLLLTHYCMAGNQPRMQARSYDAATGDLAFEFVDGTNLASPATGHMHSVTIKFVDSAHIDTVWQFHENGKATMTERARYARIGRKGLRN